MDNPPFTATDADLAQAAIERQRDHVRQVREESVTRWIEAVAAGEDTEDGDNE